MPRTHVQCLLAHLFYNTIRVPSTYNDFSYSNMIQPDKIYSILQYFLSMKRGEYNHDATDIIFVRKHINEEINWEENNNKMVDIQFHGGSMLDLNGSNHGIFANKYPGGGVLSSGFVQEEQFETQSPESLISLLLCEKMEDNEAIEIIGAERFIELSGYGSDTRFVGPYKDNRIAKDGILQSSV